MRFIDKLEKDHQAKINKETKDVYKHALENYADYLNDIE